MAAVELFNDVLKSCVYPDKIFDGQAVKSNYIAGLYNANIDYTNEKNGSAEFFWQHMVIAGLKVHEQFFQDFTFGQGYQLYNTFGSPVFSSPNITKHFKYDPIELTTRSFKELFERDSFSEARVEEMFIKAVMEQKESVLDWTSIPCHKVRQIDFPDDDFLIDFKKSYPVYDKSEYFGFVLILNLKAAR
ncbi:MAG: hypothetical protein ACOYOK_02810 [Pseudobdellovibrionaceae bacterium]